MENNSKPKKSKALIITFVIVLLLLVGGYSLFSTPKVNAVAITAGIPTTGDNNGYETTTEQTIYTCKNGADNPYGNPPCTTLNGACKFGGTYPNCSATGFSTSYLRMASAGEALTAGMIETDANVTDARKKYLTYISETESILKELNDISTKYNAIIAAAQKTRDAAVGTTPKLYCTYSELINI